ncbi:MAG: FHA domain-containing protein [Hyphomicrobium sp.]
MAAIQREERSDYRRFGLIAGVVALAAAFAISPSPIRDIQIILGVVLAFFGAVVDLVMLGYRTAPALTLCILLALAFPIVALVMRTADRSRRAREATRYYRRVRASAEADAPVDGEAVVSMPGPAFLEVAGRFGPRRYPIFRNLVRIGRDEDNDIRIPNEAVHRYHAAISREDIDVWRITDLSGLDGNRLIVNGRRCEEALLKDGDVIQLGPGRMRFWSGVVGGPFSPQGAQSP